MTFYQLSSIVIDICLGAAAFKLAWSVDKTQKTQTQILRELVTRVERLEEKVK